MSKKSQKDMVLNHLQHKGSITPWDALAFYKCFRLAAVICELRKEGWDISTKLSEKEPRYAIYSLRGEVNG